MRNTLGVCCENGPRPGENSRRPQFFSRFSLQDSGRLFFLALLTRGGGSWDLVCSSASRGRSSGGVFLNGDLKPGHGNGLQPASPITHHTVKLYVGNISFTITEADLQHIFEQFGSVIEIKIVTDRETGQPRGFAFVTLCKSNSLP